MAQATGFSKHFSLSIIVICFVILQNGHCLNTVTNKDPVVEGMEPLFAMTNGFLNVIQPQSKGNKILDIATQSIEEDSNVQVDWQKLLKHYVGYVVCLAIGVVYFVLLPIVGFCFCCCRCCGNCGGENSTMKGRHDKCKQVTFGMLFAIVNVLILAGMVCAFVTNELIRQQTSTQNDALLPVLTDNLRSLENFKGRTIHEIRTDVVGNLGDEINRVISILNSIPEDARVSVAARIQQVLDDARALATRTDSIYNTLVSVDALTVEMKADGTQLSTNLTAFSSETVTFLGTLIPVCNCPQLITDLNNLRSVDYSVLPDLSSQKDAVKSVIDADLNSKITQGEDSLNNITTDVRNSTASSVTDATASVNAVQTTVSQQVDDLESELNSAISLNNTIKSIASHQDDLEKYGNYRFYAGIGLSCVILLILLFNILGLSFGICGETPYDHSSSACNKGVGANLLMAGVGFTFLWAWLLMLVVVILFAIGGLLQTEACRVIVDVENSPAINSLDTFIQKNLNDNNALNFQISDTLSGCKNDGALYTVLGLDNLVNLTEVLDLNQYNVESEIDKLRSVSLTIPDLNIYSTELKMALDDLKASGLDSINYTMFDTTLTAFNGQITSPTLESIITGLETVSTQFTVGSFSKTDIQTRIDVLTAINTGLVAKMKVEQVNLQNDVTSLQTLVGGSNASQNFAEEVTALQTSLEAADEDLRTNAVNYTTNFIANKTTEIVQNFTYFLNNLTYNVQFKIANCKPVYDLLDSSIGAVCESTLRPFNGFWFSFGWCLLFMIPSLIFAVKLAGLYRKYDQYEQRDYKNFDDPLEWWQNEQEATLLGGRPYHR